MSGNTASSSSANGTLVADFDQNLSPINAVSPGGVAASHIVARGETLASIAAGMWGDASLWYKIAQANGLTGTDANAQLAAGTRLTIPNIVTNLHNTSETFKVYDPSQALGDTRPDSPAPPPPVDHGGGGACAVVGKILIIAVAVAVTVATSGAFAAALAPTLGSLGGAIVGGAAAGALGSVVSQGVGIAIGAQQSFSWKQVGMGFRAITPVAEIATLKIGSRPASRKASDRIEDLRAIRGVCSWSQARVTLPGWYGVGHALGNLPSASVLPA